MLEVVDARGGPALVRVLPARRAIVSWSTNAVRGAIELTVHLADGRRSQALPYVAFEPGARASLDGFDAVARIRTDIVEAAGDIVAIEVHANVVLDRVAVSVCAYDPPATNARWTGLRDVPCRSQYLDAYPGQRGWCAPAALAMLLTYHGLPRTVDAIAAGVFDRAQGGTGNWPFATAYAAACGPAAAVAYLRGLGAVEALLAEDLPCALSLAWDDGGLPGAPLDCSAGHLLVACGFTPDGDAIVNDPAQPGVRHTYPRAAFERAWIGHGGVALLVAPAARLDTLVRCANA